MIQGQYHRPPCCRRSCWPFLTRCRALKGCMSCRYIMNPGCTQSIPKLQKWRYHPNSRMNRFSAISSEISFTAMSTFPSLFHRCHGSSWHQTASKQSRVFCIFFVGESRQGSLQSSKCLKRNNTHPAKTAGSWRCSCSCARSAEVSGSAVKADDKPSRLVFHVFTSKQQTGFVYAYFGVQTPHLFDKIPSNCGTNESQHCGGVT